MATQAIPHCSPHNWNRKTQEVNVAVPQRQKPWARPLKTFRLAQPPVVPLSKNQTVHRVVNRGAAWRFAADVKLYGAIGALVNLPPPNMIYVHWILQPGIPDMPGDPAAFRKGRK